MHIRHGFVLKHKEYGHYLDKGMREHTASLFKAITFTTIEDAEHARTESIYKPKNPDEYKVVKTIEKRMEKEDDHERQHEGI